jgi:hypothetical protein
MATMKSNEITIDDYVLFKTNNLVAKVTENHMSLEPTPRRLVSLRTLDGRRFCVPIEEIEGLAVTAEMLDYNDWIIDRGGGETPMYAYYDLGNADFSRYLEYYFHEGILRGWRDKELVYLSRPGIRYVHKLQHALRENGVQTELVIKNKATNNE